ncbi:MAG: SDR family oxidoreductase [Candidatus Binatia bacterium]|nr:SDR family oxidoreductase [Candidatus Binatia bacterium]
MPSDAGRVVGKVALITGAASGLGEADAHRLAEEGARVVLTDINVAAGEAVAQACGGVFLAQDVGDEATWPKVIEQTLAAHGRLDVLVNNAGIAPIGDIETTTVEVWRKTLRVHLDGTFFGCHYAMPALIESGGGSIINMSSITALIGHAPYLAYSAAKGGIRSMTKSIAAYGKAKNRRVRCNSIHPGSISTPMVHQAMESLMGVKLTEAEDPEALRTKLGIGEPNDVANMVLFLASDESKHMSGAELVIDNGSAITQGGR